MKPKEILVFGASGQIGRHLLRKLTKKKLFAKFCRILKYSPATPAPVGKCCEKVSGGKYFSNFLHENRCIGFNRYFRLNNRTATNPNPTP